jgi:hypothetical protein
VGLQYNNNGGKMKTIKKIETNRYDLALLEADDGYTVCYTTKVEKVKSENIIDYSTASYLFDLKLQELEGN